MKTVSALAALLILSGCATTAPESQVQQLENTEVVQEKEQKPITEVVESTSLTVITTPSDARVRIMNIVPVYEDAIELEDGKYDIEVSKPGYQTYRKWMTIDKKIILTVELVKKDENKLVN